MALRDNARPEATSTAPHGRALRAVAVVALILTLAAAAGIVWLIKASATPQTGALTAPEAYPPGEPGEVLAPADAEAAVPDLAAIMPDLLADPGSTATCRRSSPTRRAARSSTSRTPRPRSPRPRP
ncbi:hypothetical protein GCM10029992_05230 [Glycomyces albus]